MKGLLLDMISLPLDLIDLFSDLARTIIPGGLLTLFVLSCLFSASIIFWPSILTNL